MADGSALPAQDSLSFLSGANAVFLVELYERYLTQPDALDPTWRDFFANLGDEAEAVLTDAQGPGWGRIKAKVIGVPDPDAPPPAKGDKAKGGRDQSAAQAAVGGAKALEQAQRESATASLRTNMLVRAYRISGHLNAKLDPLGISNKAYRAELVYSSYGFSEADLNREMFLDGALGLDRAPLRTIMERLERTYSGSIGVEFMHILDRDQKNWLQHTIEGTQNQPSFTREQKYRILTDLTRAELFERYLNTKYPGTKRFGVDGGESVVPLIEQMLHTSSRFGASEAVIGMAHRGRLNLLANVMRKPFTTMFAEFQGASANPDDVQGSGDVKYHLGASCDREFEGQAMHLSLNANPSHLEAVDPVIIGRVRAKQQQIGDSERASVIPILLHGDAAFAGQGIVPETLDMSELKGYRVGGSIHVIVNNQIGFTTKPADARSGPYATEFAKVIQAPIFHVNGDDVEAVVHVAAMAAEFRQRFKKPAIIDMWCYRRHGHNESDEPAFTQPLMYRAIKDHPSTRTLYARKLVAEGTFTEAEVDQVQKDFTAELDAAFEASKAFRANKADWLEGAWSGMEAASGEDRRGVTEVPFDRLNKVGAALTTIPDTFKLNSKIARQLKAKEQAITSGEGIDWATGEALAFGTLLDEGYHVRLSGQDCGRGTFSQRHAALYDQENEEKYLPLQHIDPAQGKCEIIDSPLAEFSVLGFEYGFSVTEPNALVMWEAQFGDFANGAQVIFDQFISSGESKWLRMSGLVVLLPHGYEGQGPEHSSARLERFLQMCGEDNMQVCNLTTPANYYHALRRQLHRPFRKPLIIMTPKSLLRHKRCVSPLSAMGPGTTFHRVLPERYQADLKSDDQIHRVVVCSGKVYYDLLQEREEQKINDVAIVTMEQFYPFPRTSLTKQFARYPNTDVVWCQEEPANMGGWSFVRWQVQDCMAAAGLKHNTPGYAGRGLAASPATGSAKRHAKEQADLVTQALTV